MNEVHKRVHPILNHRCVDCGGIDVVLTEEYQTEIEKIDSFVYSMNRGWRSARFVYHRCREFVALEVMEA